MNPGPLAPRGAECSGDKPRVATECRKRRGHVPVADVERIAVACGQARVATDDIGRIEPKLEQDLIRLLDIGNQYSVFVTAAQEQSINVIIRETHRSATMGSRPSFRPSAAPEGGVRAYTREGMLRYEMEEEEEEDDELGDDDEEEAEVVPADLEVGVEETPLETLAAEEDTEWLSGLAATTKSASPENSTRATAPVADGEETKDYPPSKQRRSGRLWDGYLARLDRAPGRASSLRGPR